jgi:hypothetical protein
MENNLSFSFDKKFFGYCIFILNHGLYPLGLVFFRNHILPGYELWLNLFRFLHKYRDLIALEFHLCSIIDIITLNHIVELYQMGNGVTKCY